jgi:uncharacterized Ntn-hydrolase superfamily protein
VTFSIVAADLERGEWGIAVASRTLAVGAMVPRAAAGIGAVAGQSGFGPPAAPALLEALAQTGRADVALRRVLDADADAVRQAQFGVVDRSGAATAHTGPACTPWAGHRVGDGFTCQGNFLVGPRVVESLFAEFAHAREVVSLSLALLQGLKAGDDAGGDARGRQSAALLVVRAASGFQGRSDRYLDLRVDDHPRPIEELVRLLAVHQTWFGSRRDEPVDRGRPELQRDLALLLGMVAQPPARGADRDIWTEWRAYCGEQGWEDDSVTVDRLVHLKRQAFASRRA